MSKESSEVTAALICDPGANLARMGARPYRMVDKPSTFWERITGRGATQKVLDLTDEPRAVTTAIRLAMLDRMSDPETLEEVKATLKGVKSIDDDKATFRNDRTARRFVRWLEAEQLGRPLMPKVLRKVANQNNTTDFDA